MRHCRNCTAWRQTGQWRGNCDRHPWPKPKWNEDATAIGCDDYADRYSDFQPIGTVIKQVLKEVN